MLLIFVKVVAFVKFEENLWSGSFQLIIMVDDIWVFFALRGGLGFFSLSIKGEPLYLFLGVDILSI